MKIIKSKNEYSKPIPHVCYNESQKTILVKYAKTGCAFDEQEMYIRNLHIFSNPYLWFKPLIFHTYIIVSNRIHSLEYLTSTTLGCKNIKIRYMILWQRLNSVMGAFVFDILLDLPI